MFASDTEGSVHVFEYTYNFDDYKKNNSHFVLVKSVKNHNLGCIKSIPSPFDSTFYSIGFDNKLYAYNMKEKKISLDIFNNKCFYTDFLINSTKQEVILSDEKGYISFVKIFNHSETKVKTNYTRVNNLFKIDSKNNNQSLVIISEDSIEQVFIKREVKTVNVSLHEDQIIKIFVIDPVKNKNGDVIEDTK